MIEIILKVLKDIICKLPKNLEDDGIVHLTRRFLYPKQKPSRLKHIRLDRRALAEQYLELKNAGACSNQADIARHFGVSRAWVTKIMNTMKPNVTVGE